MENFIFLCSGIKNIYKSRIQLLIFENIDWNLLKGIFQLKSVPWKEWRLGIKGREGE